MEKEKYITVSAFAKAVGTTNQAIYQQLDKRLKPYYKVIDNKKMLSTRAIQEIYEKEVDKDSQSKQSNENQELINSLKAHIETLQTQLSVANDEKAEKDKQIADLTATVKALGQSINAREHSELAETVQPLIEDGSTSTGKEKKKHWWQRGSR